MQSSSGDIWLATDGEGLIRVGPDGKEVHVYTVDDNLVSNSINLRSKVSSVENCVNCEIQRLRSLRFSKTSVSFSLRTRTLSRMSSACLVYLAL